MKKEKIKDFYYKGKSNWAPGEEVELLPTKFLLLANSLDDKRFKSFFFHKRPLLKNDRTECNIIDNAYSILFDFDMIHVDKEDNWNSKVMCHKNLITIDGVDKWYIITDWPDTHPKGNYPAKDMVFPIHFESLYLCNSLTNVKNKKVLDVFCGSGILGLYAALSKASEVHFIDNNPRCLAFTQFNFMLNRHHIKLCNYTLYESNIFEKLDSSSETNKYDVILANPPFEPVPASLSDLYFTHSYGGDDGQAFLSTFLQQCKDYLREAGAVIGVDFSPGPQSATLKIAKQEEKQLKLSEILKEMFTPGLSYYDPLDSCNIKEFASRYIALGMTIQQYQDWFKNLDTDNLTRLYFCWFVTTNNKDILESIKSNYISRQIKENWVNPVQWNYPCGITSANRLQWTYLEDSFYIRDLIYNVQLKNEKLLSSGENPEYLKFEELENAKGFPDAINFCNSVLEDFQYGVLGKPDHVVWMTFPEIVNDKERSKGYFVNGKERLPEGKIELIDKIEKSLLQANKPKILVFFEIHNKVTTDCKYYLGDFASFTMSLILTNGKKVIYENETGILVTKQIGDFISYIKSADGIGKKVVLSFCNGKNIEPLQTYCFIFSWPENNSEIFSNLLNYPDDVFFDGVYKRLSFVISQGLNLVAMVGLAKQVSKAEDLYRYERASDKITKLIEDLNKSNLLAKEIDSIIKLRDSDQSYLKVASDFTDKVFAIDGTTKLFDRFHQGSDWDAVDVETREFMFTKINDVLNKHIGDNSVNGLQVVFKYLAEYLLSDKNREDAFNILKLFFETNSVSEMVHPIVIFYFILQENRKVNLYYNSKSVSDLNAIFFPSKLLELRERFNLAPGASAYFLSNSIVCMIRALSINDDTSVKINRVEMITSLNPRSAALYVYCDKSFLEEDINKINEYFNSNDQKPHDLRSNLRHIANCIVGGEFRCINSETDARLGINLLNDSEERAKFIVKFTR